LIEIDPSEKFLMGHAVLPEKLRFEMNEYRNMKIIIHDPSLEIHPITPDDLDAVLVVYKECEDFLALGPVSTASMKMVEADLELSRSEHGFFCGIYQPDGRMIGVFDFVPDNYRGDPGIAYLELLMIAAPFRSLGIGKAVVEAVENEIRKGEKVNIIMAGVQVNNPVAIRFWTRNGYRIVSEPKLYPDQTTAVDLRKDFP
jgi:ribosomal protein S18 acetylase RimI-like enzyme